MIYGHLIRPPAEADIAKAALWYERKQTGLGEEFLQETDRLILLVLEYPIAFPVIHQRCEVRRALAKRFPYRLYFSVEGNQIIIHAVLHFKRSEKTLKRRL